MRSYCSLYVDAGYLFAAASTRVTGTSLRSATQVDVAALIEDLIRQAEADCGLPLLRVHWYDAGNRQGAPNPQQQEIARLPKVKLRLGRTGFEGEQKGVDIKLALDLITQSRNKASEVVYLISGDDDLSEAVEEAQQHGVQVISLVAPDAAGEPFGVSGHLRLTVDQMQLIDPTTIDQRVKRSVAAALREVAAAPTTAVAEPAQDVEAVAEGPGIPSPLTMPKARAVVTELRRPSPVYSTSTGEAPSGAASLGDAEISEAITDVVDNVVVNWWRGASPTSREELERGRPTIPSEIDRVLLSDLSNRLSVWDIPQDWRFALRDAFWVKIDKL